MTTRSAIDSTEATIVHVHPSSVTIAPNIRTVVEPEPGFLDSVRAAGRILHPVIGIRLPDGSIHIIDGQLRTLAAQEIGLTELPVYLTTGTQTDLDDVAENVTNQFVSNVRRTPITTGDKIAALHLLEVEGLSVAKIAKATGTSRDEVTATLTVAKNEFAAEVAAHDGVDLVQAAAIAEFDGYPELQESLAHYAIDYPSSFTHELQRAKDARDRRIAFADSLTELVAKGVVILEGDHVAEGDLITMLTAPAEDGEHQKALTSDEHAACPGRAFRAITNHWGGYLNEVCLEAIGNGHLARYTGAAVTSAAPVSEEEAAAAADAAREVASLERRRVRINNVDWQSATTVRREWLTEFVNRKKLPADALQFAVIALSRFRFETNNASTTITRAMFGLGGCESFGKSAVAEYAIAHPTKALNLITAHALGLLEDATNGDTWRSGGAAHEVYLEQLGRWGYPLARVEKVLLGEDDLAAYEKK